MSTNPGRTFWLACVVAAMTCGNAALAQSSGIEAAKRRAAESRARIEQAQADRAKAADAAAKADAAAATPAAVDPASLKPDQAVEVREGDEWSKATFLKREGRKLQVRYADGTDEWVTADRLRVPGAAGAAPADGKPGATTKKAPKETFAIGAKVEVKSTAWWKPATIKNKDGDLYLIVYDDRPKEMWWEWVHPGIIRKPGSDQDWPEWGNGVGVRMSGVAKAKDEAKLKFANIDAEMAAAAKGEKKDPFAPLAYDKPITDAKLDKVDDIIPGAGPAKLAAFDPAPALKLAERGYVLKGKGSKWQSGGPAALMLAGTRGVAAYTTDGMGADTRTASLELLDLAGGRSLDLVDADPMSMPRDLSPSGEHIVGVQHGFHSGTRVRVDLHSIKSGAKVEHVASFVPYSGDKTYKDVDYARFAGDDDHILTCNNGGSLVLWDAPKATAVWRVKLPWQSTPAVSPGGKQVAFVDEGALFVLDILSGKVLCRIPSDRSMRSLSFSPDGKRVVGLSSSGVVAWDLEQGTALPDIGLPVKGAGGSAVALDGRFVLIGGTDVLDLDKKIVAWHYNVSTPHMGGSIVRVHGGRCWTVMVDDQRAVLASAKLPHDAARKAADQVPVGHGLLVRPGDAVALSVAIEAPADQQQKIIAAMTQQLMQAGIKVDPNSPIKLNARTEQGKTSTQTYEVTQFGRPFDRKQETVSVTEKITRVYFEFDGKVAWENRTSTGGAPMMVTTRGDQTINDAVQAGSKFNLAFLESVRVPAYIPRASDTPWLGESAWGMSGVSKDQLTGPLPAPARAAAAPAKKAPAAGDGLE
jgi:hypothetical protein